MGQGRVWYHQPGPDVNGGTLRIAKECSTRQIRNGGYEMWQTKWRIIGVLSVFWLLRAQASSGPSISVSISTPNTTVRVGQPIPIRIDLKNTSNSEVRIGRVTSHGQAELDYEVVLLDSAGHPVPQTKYGDAAANRQVIIVSRELSPVAPAETTVQRTELTKLFNITKPGTYTVRVGRRWPPMKGKIEWSNTLTLTITN